MLEGRNLVKIFGKRKVVNNVNIKVGQKEVVGLLGRNGAGKSTTFKMIMGILNPNTGGIYFDSKEITKEPVYRRAKYGIGYLAQEPSVFLRMSVLDNIRAVLELTDIKRGDITTRAEEALKEMQLTHITTQFAYTLSGGEKRRLEVARALVLNPKIMLLDEPFAGVDPIAVSDLQKIVIDLKVRKGIGILITDHNVRETLRITDHAYIIDQGTVLASGTPQEIVNNPLVREKYLGADFTL